MGNRKGVILLGRGGVLMLPRPEMGRMINEFAVGLSWIVPRVLSTGHGKGIIGGRAQRLLWLAS